MVFLKKCPKCGIDRPYTSEFCFNEHCPTCGSTLIKEPRFRIGRYRYICEKCGAKFSTPVTSIELVEATIKCPSCGSEMPIEAKYCGVCGTKLTIRLYTFFYPEALENMQLRELYLKQTLEERNNYRPWELYNKKEELDVAAQCFGRLAVMYKDLGKYDIACECFHMAGKCAFMYRDYYFAELELARCINLGIHIGYGRVLEAAEDLRNLYIKIKRDDLARKVNEKMQELIIENKKGIICPQCGDENPAFAKFCGKCGAKLK